MSITYFEKADGSYVLTTNSLVDHNDVIQYAEIYFTDYMDVDHQIFYINFYPSSLLPGSRRRFTSGGSTRVFTAQVGKRIFKA